MAVESTVSPEHHSLSYVQHRGRYDEVQKYQNARKRSSKDFYPPLMASVRRFSVRIRDERVSLCGLPDVKYRKRGENYTVALLILWLIRKVLSDMLFELFESQTETNRFNKI